MPETALIPFWIVPPSEHSFRAFGVTAFSLADALRIIQDAGYELPEDRSALRVTQGIRVDDLDERHVVPNMGPIVVRGMWYPFSKVGI